MDNIVIHLDHRSQNGSERVPEEVPKNQDQGTAETSKNSTKNIFSRSTEAYSNALTILSPIIEQEIKSLKRDKLNPLWKSQQAYLDFIALIRDKSSQNHRSSKYVFSNIDIAYVTGQVLANLTRSSKDHEMQEVKNWWVNAKAVKKLADQGEPVKQPPQPPPSKSLWVGNAHGLTESQIRDAFAAFGRIDSMKVIPDSHCAFINYDTHDSAKTAFTQLNGYQLGSKPLVLNWRPSTSDADSKKLAKKSNSFTESRALWVGNVAVGVDEADLHRIFGRHGQIESMRLIKPKHCAFINYYKKEDAVRALKETQGRELAGARLKLNYGRPFDTDADYDQIAQESSKRRTPSRSPPRRSRRSRSRSRGRSRSRSPRNRPKRERSRDSKRTKSKSRSKSRSSSRSRARSKSRNRSNSRSRDRSRDAKRTKSKSRSRSRDRNRRKSPSPKRPKRAKTPEQQPTPPKRKTPPPPPPEVIHIEDNDQNNQTNNNSQLPQQNGHTDSLLDGDIGNLLKMARLKSVLSSQNVTQEQPATPLAEQSTQQPTPQPMDVETTSKPTPEITITDKPTQNPIAKPVEKPTERATEKLLEKPPSTSTPLPATETPKQTTITKPANNNSFTSTGTDRSRIEKISKMAAMLSERLSSVETLNSAEVVMQALNSSVESEPCGSSESSIDFDIPSNGRNLYINTTNENSNNNTVQEQLNELKSEVATIKELCLRMLGFFEHMQRQ